MAKITVGGTAAKQKGTLEDAKSYERNMPDRRQTMPTGGYRFGASNPALRPNVPKGK